MSKSEVLLMMSGSIAAYKACHVVSRLVQAGHGVQVVASKSALNFVGAATLEGLSGRPVASDLWSPGRAMEHIHLIRKADLVLAAPASAHLINRMAHGLGDDLLTTLFLAHDFSKPFLVAPAMNTSMYLHPTTQASIKRLREMGVEILETASGVLACGEVGYGKLLDPDLMLEEVLKRLPTKPIARPSGGLKQMAAPKVLVTAGGTSEKLDSVRRITNSSTGRSGRRLADDLHAMGFDVTLMRARQAEASHEPGLRQLQFEDFNSLESSLKAELAQGQYTHVIHMAAVSDYRLDGVRVDGLPVEPGNGKIPSGRKLELILEPTPKIIAGFRGWSGNPHLRVVGFKLTSGASEADRRTAAGRVLEHSNLVIGNDVSEFDPVTGDHPYRAYSQNGTHQISDFNELSAYLTQWILTGEEP